MGSVLAETIKLSGTEVLIILLVLLGSLLAVVAVMGLGCLWAWRAGRGSQLALAGWVVCGTLEGSVILLGLASLLRGQVNAVGTVPAGALAAQVGLYLAARGKPRPAP
jgi:hypothetical protein